jgi:glycosyltransferase involved in cell wall biosynthesis
LENTIIHITESLARGGAETLLVGVIQSLKQYKHLVISLRKRNDFLEELEDIEIHYLDLKGYASIPRILGKVKRLVQFQTGNVIVHAHMFWANVISRLSVPRTMPLINSYHSVSYGRQGANYPLHAVLLDRLTYKKRITVICVSKAVRQNVERYIGVADKIHVLYNYINDSFFKVKENSYKPGQRLRLVSVGNLKLQKNYSVSLEALSLLKKSDEQAEYSLDIYGKGPLLEALKEKTDKLGLDTVQFKGVSPDVAERLPCYDAYLLSSSYEGFGIAVAEAMASGLPVIVSDLPVLREVTGGNALFFNPQNPEELKEQILSVFEGRVDLEKLAIGGREKAEDYRKSNYIEKLGKIYEKASNSF